MPRDPDFDSIRAWQGIFRNSIAVLVGAFMLVYDTAFATTPNQWVIGGGIAAIGFPVAAKFDIRRRDAPEE